MLLGSCLNMHCISFILLYRLWKFHFKIYLHQRHGSWRVLRTITVPRTVLLWEKDLRNYSPNLPTSLFNQPAAIWGVCVFVCAYPQWEVNSIPVLMFKGSMCTAVFIDSERVDYSFEVLWVKSELQNWINWHYNLLEASPAQGGHDKVVALAGPLESCMKLHNTNLCTRPTSAACMKINHHDLNTALWKLKKV